MKRFLEKSGLTDPTRICMNNEITSKYRQQQNGTIMKPQNSVAPLADIYETPEEYVLTLDMPGSSKEGISLTLEKGILQVRASVEQLHPESTNILYRELRTMTYQRAFTLGEGVDRNNIDALFENGVLTVKMFKTPETKPKQITIH
jgi:HSP20 family protein